MNIKTLISLKQKINELQFNFSNQNKIEKIFDKLFFLFILSIISISGFLSIGYIFAQNILFASFSLFGGLTLVFIILFTSNFFSKLFLKKQSKIYKIISNKLPFHTKFNKKQIINNTLIKLTQEEISLLQEIEKITDNNNSDLDFFEKQILNCAKNVNKEELDFILASTTNEKLRYQIFEISQNLKEEKLHINQQTIIKNI